MPLLFASFCRGEWLTLKHLANTHTLVAVFPELWLPSKLQRKRGTRFARFCAIGVGLPRRVPGGDYEDNCDHVSLVQKILERKKNTRVELEIM